MTDPKAIQSLLTGSAYDLIYSERIRQVLKEGHENADDDREVTGALVEAAISYCWAAADQINNAKNTWPWGGDLPDSLTRQRDSYCDCTKPLDIRQLVIAGALIAAEIERLQRKYRAEREAEDRAAEGEASR